MAQVEWRRVVFEPSKYEVDLFWCRLWRYLVTWDYLIPLFISGILAATTASCYDFGIFHSTTREFLHGFTAGFIGLHEAMYMQKKWHWNLDQFQMQSYSFSTVTFIVFSDSLVALVPLGYCATNGHNSIKLILFLAWPHPCLGHISRETERIKAIAKGKTWEKTREDLRNDLQGTRKLIICSTAKNYRRRPQLSTYVI